MNLLRRMFQSKASEARSLISITESGKPQMTPVNYAALSQEAYRMNHVAYRAIGGIGRSIADLKWLLFKRTSQGRVEVTEHELLDLLKKPNPMQGGAAFFECMASYYMIAGNVYVEGVAAGRGAPTELWCLRPDRIKIEAGPLGFPGAYIYTYKSFKKVFEVDFVKMESPIMHVRTFNPTDDWYGMSPIEAARLAVGSNNKISSWNLALLQNSAVPSGVLTVSSSTANPGAKLSEKQFQRAKKELEERYSGPAQQGRPMLLEGGMQWQQLALSPKDMDWLKSKHTSARDIASVFGYPPLLLNIPGDNTFSNYKEARMALYEETILPLAGIFRDALNNWLVPKFGENLELDIDEDAIPALAPKRAEKFDRISSAKHLTVNEKREMTGFSESEGWDVIMVPSSENAVTLKDPDFETTPPPPPEPEPDPEPEDEPEDNEDDEGDEDDGKSVKLFRANSETGKQRVARAQLRKKEQLQSAFEKDVREDLEDIAKKVASRVAESAGPDVAEFAATAAIDSSLDSLEKTLFKHIRRGINEFGLSVIDEGKAFTKVEHKQVQRFLDFAKQFVESRTADAIGKIGGTTIKTARNKIKKIIADSLDTGITTNEIAKELQNELVGLSKSKAQTIARVETQIASQQGALEGAKSLDDGSMMKEWVSILDDRTRNDPGFADHFGAHGQRVKVDEQFKVDPDTLMNGPGDPSAPPEQVINCRCAMVFSRETDNG